MSLCFEHLVAHFTLKNDCIRGLHLLLPHTVWQSAVAAAEPHHESCYRKRGVGKMIDAALLVAKQGSEEVEITTGLLYCFVWSTPCCKPATVMTRK